MTLNLSSNKKVFLHINNRILQDEVYKKTDEYSIIDTKEVEKVKGLETIDKDKSSNIDKNIITKRWIGRGKDNKWSTKDNWEDNKVPTLYDSVIIGESKKDIFIDTDVTLHSIIITSFFNNRLLCNSGTKLKVNDRIIVEGGELIVNESIEGNIILRSGMIKYTSSGNVILGNIVVYGGIFIYTCKNFYSNRRVVNKILGDIMVNNGIFKYNSGSMNNNYINGKIIINGGAFIYSGGTKYYYRANNNILNGIEVNNNGIFSYTEYSPNKCNNIVYGDILIKDDAKFIWDAYAKFKGEVKSIGEKSMIKKDIWYKNC
jgi:hypothetical protein